MGAPDEQIRMSETVKRTLERHRREGESYNDVLGRLLEAVDAGDFAAGFGCWSEDEADCVREGREQATARRERRLWEQTDNGP